MGFENDSDYSFEQFYAGYDRELANGYITTSAPWGLAKAGDDARLDAVLAALAHCLMRLAVMSSPFMPEKSQALWAALGQGGTPEAAWAMAEEPWLAGAKVAKPENLFPKPPTP